jgi:hypothetical protein
LRLRFDCAGQNRKENLTGSALEKTSLDSQTVTVKEYDPAAGLHTQDSGDMPCLGAGYENSLSGILVGFKEKTVHGISTAVP